VKQLADDFATYVYLPRLKNSDVLLGAIRDGAGLILWEKEGFAYADFYDETRGRYNGLSSGPTSKIEPRIMGDSVVVKTEIARKQIDADTAAAAAKAGAAAPTYTPSTAGQPIANGPAVIPAGPTAPVRPKRFWADVDMDPIRFSKEAGQIAEAIVQHLSGLMHSNVKISLQIEAKVEGGIPENVERTVSENCRTLGIKEFNFEEK
jgi:hypothetical protein